MAWKYSTAFHLSSLLVVSFLSLHPKFIFCQKSDIGEIAEWWGKRAGITRRQHQFVPRSIREKNVGWSGLVRRENQERRGRGDREGREGKRRQRVKVRQKRRQSHFWAFDGVFETFFVLVRPNTHWWMVRRRELGCWCVSEWKEIQPILLHWINSLTPSLIVM